MPVSTNPSTIHRRSAQLLCPSARLSMSRATTGGRGGGGDPLQTAAAHLQHRPRVAGDGRHQSRLRAAATPPSGSAQRQLRLSGGNRRPLGYNDPNSQTCCSQTARGTPTSINSGIKSLSHAIPWELKAAQINAVNRYQGSVADRDKPRPQTRHRAASPSARNSPSEGRAC